MCKILIFFLCIQVIVHFGASWCVPSLAMNGYFEELAHNYHDILFLLVDVDEVKVLSFLSTFLICNNYLYQTEGFLFHFYSGNYLVSAAIWLG